MKFPGLGSRDGRPSQVRGGCQEGKGGGRGQEEGGRRQATRRDIGPAPRLPPGVRPVPLQGPRRRPPGVLPPGLRRGGPVSPTQAQERRGRRVVGREQRLGQSHATGDRGRTVRDQLGTRHRRHPDSVGVQPPPVPPPRGGRSGLRQGGHARRTLRARHGDAAGVLREQVHGGTVRPEAGGREGG